MSKSPVLWCALLLLATGLFTLSGPVEKTLGANARIVYLHGAWVWTALAAFLAAAVLGGLGILLRRTTLQRWSRAVGRTGLVFWITYLPISMWAMQTSWNGLFLSEPRWRLAVIFATAGLLLQIGVSLLEKPFWAAIANGFFGITLLLALSQTQNVMHPPSPILNSEAARIQIFFMGLLALTLILAWQVTRWWYTLESTAARMPEYEPG
ncbi:MAG: hypothetical protein A2Z16_04105 [Chloroflexi bacterium RBG_16_54_18]|nr:MAG: hypothetical protein A2Z16_04105 [Chloroflexi bacterium RBG_16_54_18]